MRKNVLLPLTFLVTSMVPQSEHHSRSFDDVVKSHVRLMIFKGYANTISLDDLNHGHIFLSKSKKDCYSGLDKVLDKTELILYHSAEHNYRWKIDRELAENNIPRSIIGLMDGSAIFGREYDC